MIALSLTIFQVSPQQSTGSALPWWLLFISQEASGVRVHLVLQLQDSRVGLLEVLLKLQSQIVDSNGGNWWHAALGRLRRACGGGAVQNKPQHDDSEGQDVEPRKLIAKEKESKEKAVEVSCQDAQVDRSGTSNFNHQWHEAVQTKHTEGKCHKQQGCLKKKERKRITIIIVRNENA